MENVFNLHVRSLYPMVKLLLWRASWPGENVLKLNWPYSVLSKDPVNYFQISFLSVTTWDLLFAHDTFPFDGI
jgi:hypothetical protein